MAQMNPTKDIIAKRLYYLMILDLILLSKEHAWNYIGDKASHDAFTAAEGLTPKHFLRQLIQDHQIISKMIAPAHKLKTTIEATLSLWTARTRQWRERYGNIQTALCKWPDDAYPEAGPIRSMPHTEATRNANVGDMIMVPELTPIESFEHFDGEHGFEVWMTKLDPRDGKGRTPYGVCVEEVELCHPGCEVGRKLYEEKLESAAKKVLPELEARQGQVPFMY